MCCSTTLTMTGANSIFSSANMVSMLIKGLLLQFKSDKLDKYSSATRCSFSRWLLVATISMATERTRCCYFFNFPFLSMMTLFVVVCSFFLFFNNFYVYLQINGNKRHIFIRIILRNCVKFCFSSCNTYNSFASMCLCLCRPWKWRWGPSISAVQVRWQNKFFKIFYCFQYKLTIEHLPINIVESRFKNTHQVLFSVWWTRQCTALKKPVHDRFLGPVFMSQFY